MPKLTRPEKRQIRERLRRHYAQLIRNDTVALGDLPDSIAAHPEAEVYARSFQGIVADSIDHSIETFPDAL